MIEIVNTKDYIKNGEYLSLKNDGNILMRFYFADFNTDSECYQYAELVRNLLEASIKIKLTE